MIRYEIRDNDSQTRSGGTLISIIKTEFFSQCYRKLNQLNIFNNSTFFLGQFLLHFGISNYILKQQ